jgi:hypothetical protein
VLGGGGGHFRYASFTAVGSTCSFASCNYQLQLGKGRKYVYNQRSAYLCSRHVLHVIGHRSQTYFEYVSELQSPATSVHSSLNDPICVCSKRVPCQIRGDPRDDGLCCSAKEKAIAAQDAWIQHPAKGGTRTTQKFYERMIAQLSAERCK